MIPPELNGLAVVLFLVIVFLLVEDFLIRRKKETKPANWLIAMDHAHLGRVWLVDHRESAEQRRVVTMAREHAQVFTDFDHANDVLNKLDGDWFAVRA